MSPNPTRVCARGDPRTCADGPCPEGPRDGFFYRLGVLHHGDERVIELEASVPVPGGGHGHATAFLVSAAGTAPGHLDDDRLNNEARERVEVTKRIARARRVD